MTGPAVVDQHVPEGPAVRVSELLTGVIGGDAPALEVGDERVRAFLARLSAALLRPAVARRFPELASLGFFLRPGSVDRVLARLPRRDDEVRTPRGLVLHIAPANVDTVFLYSWALSALAGNSNVVRISPRAGAAARHVLHLLNTLLPQADPALAQTQFMIGYGHDAATTAELTAACDLRVIWGGDQTVDAIRGTAPLPAHAHDLVFPDRSSFTVLSADGWLGADDRTRTEAVEGMYNDAYWFDQAACASPRAQFWVGGPQAVERAREEFRTRLLAVVADRSPVVDASMAVHKRVSLYGLAADGIVRSLRFAGNAYAAAELTRPELLPRHWMGAGVFLEARVDRLADLLPVVSAREQTVAHFGFDPDEVVRFARDAAPRGVRRLVPVGRALDFSAVWDGHDLLHEYTRITTLC